jgi:hypothetical protein
LTLRVSNHRGDPVTEQQLARMAKRRLAILRHAEEITGNVALTDQAAATTTCTPRSTTTRGWPMSRS